MNNAKNMVFCVGNDAERELAFLDYAAFAGIPVRKLVGSYKGVTENSFEAPAKYAHDILPIIHGEESVLLLRRGDRRQVQRHSFSSRQRWRKCR